MTKHDDEPRGLVDLTDVSDGLTAGSTIISVAQAAGVEVKDVEKYKSKIKTARGAIETGTTVAAVGLGAASATSLSVSATSGAGIAAGLASAGSVIGMGMVGAVPALAAGPTYFGAKGINQALYSENADDNEEEATAKKVARLGTHVGGAAGIAAAGTAVVSGGASGAAIMSTLAGVGSVVGGGAIAGTAVLAAAPIAVAGGVGYGLYRLLGGGKKNAKPNSDPDDENQFTDSMTSLKTKLNESRHAAIEKSKKVKRAKALCRQALASNNPRTASEAIALYRELLAIASNPNIIVNVPHIESQLAKLRPLADGKQSG